MVSCSESDGGREDEDKFKAVLLLDVGGGRLRLKAAAKDAG